MTRRGVQAVGPQRAVRASLEGVEENVDPQGPSRWGRGCDGQDNVKRRDE
jgi:hypothetical protein